MTKKRFIVYCIEIDGIIRYVGKTNNLSRRQSQHRVDFKSGKKKVLFEMIKINYPSFNEKDIQLKVIKQFNNEVDAKRFECFMILGDYFKDKNLWQKVPNIIDGW